MAKDIVQDEVVDEVEDIKDEKKSKSKKPKPSILGSGVVKISLIFNGKRYKKGDKLDVYNDDEKTALANHIDWR